jgi:acetyl esterase/lipase
MTEAPRRHDSCHHPLVLAATVTILATGGIVAPPSVAAPAAQSETLTDVAYVDDPHPEQHLDFYWPAAIPSATVLFIHGGSLNESGQRRDSEVYAQVCPRLVAAGVGCATIDYRLSPSYQWPAMPLDVAAAVVEVRALVAERGGDPDRLLLFGHSSGCHLAAILGANTEYLAAVGLSPDNIAGVVAMGCVLDNHDAQLRGATAELIRDNFQRSQSDVRRFGTAESWIAANPSFHIGEHTPPTRVVVAEAERFMPAILEQGARYVRRLLEMGVDADVVIVPGRHMSSIASFGTADDPTLAVVLELIATTETRPRR